MLVSSSESAEVCQMAYEGNYSLFKIRIDNDRSLAARNDTVCVSLCELRVYQPTRSLQVHLFNFCVASSSSSVECPQSSG